MDKYLETSTSSDTQPGALTNAELGALFGVVIDVTQGFELVQSVNVRALQPAGNAGAVTPSKFSVH